MKEQNKTKLKEQMLEELAQKFNQSQFKNSSLQASNEKGETELNLVQQTNSPREVGQKVHKAMMANRHKMGNMRPIDFSKIPSTFYDDKGDTVTGADLDPETPPPNTLPATISKELRAAGTLDIKWTDTRDLPRGQDRDIRALAKGIFSAFNIEENAEVFCINSFKDDTFLNEPREINAVLGHLDKYASSPHIGTMIQDFGNTIQDYKPEIKVYHTPTTAYLVVNEPEGQGLEGNYIYAFKRKPDNKLQNKKNEKIEDNGNKRLKNRP